MLLADQIGVRQIESGSRSAAAMVAALTGRAEDARATAEAGLAASRAAGEVTFEAHNLAWGDNRIGELGTGTTASVTGPVQVTGLTGAMQVAAGAGASFAVHVVPLTAVLT